MILSVNARNVLHTQYVSCGIRGGSYAAKLGSKTCMHSNTLVGR
jgi:hypothetical protein